METILNLVGETYGRLTVIRKSEPYICPKGKRYSKWLCQCECGNTKEVRTNHLRSGAIQSCGCLQKESVTTHGHTIRKPETPCTKLGKHTRRLSIEYSSWISMKARCYNPNQPVYKHYGGRGITVYDEWKDDFQAFYDYIGPAPIGCNSIDRIDNEGNYEPGNVRWSNPTEQARNRKNNKLTEEDVREIRYLINKGEKKKTITNLYNLSESNFYNIKNGKTWKDVV